MNSIALILALAIAQSPATPTTESVQAPPQMAEYELGPGDVISIQVSGVTQFDQRVRVSNSGRIRVPYVGVIYVAGKTTLEAEQEIGSLIKDHELVTNPAVRVSVERYHARPTYAIGDVSLPGQYMITGDMYLLDLIAKAGGLTPAAASSGFIYRHTVPKPDVEVRIAAIDGAAHPPSTPPAAATEIPPPPAVSDEDPTEQVIQVDFDALRDGTKPEMNVRLQGGDVLYVPRRRQENFYVIGDVNVPGAYQLPRGEVLTAAQAVIYAGGTLATAKSGKGFLMRHDDVGGRLAIPVDFRAIIEGKEPDVPIEADDIIFIPNSAVRTIGVGLLNMMPAMLQQWLIF